MKKHISLILLLVFLTSCGTTAPQEEVTQDIKPKYVKTQIVEKKIFSEDIKLVGKVSSSKETGITPLASGVIKEVYVKVGDSVKAGDVLATIDTQSNLTNINLNNAQSTYNNTVTIYNATRESLQKTLESAKLQYDNAVISRDNAYTSTQKQLELAQSQLAAVDTQKNNTTKTNQTSLALAQESLVSAKLNLENFNANYEETMRTLNVKKDSLIDNMKVSVDSAVASINSTLQFVDTVIGITPANQHLIKDYEIYLSAQQPSLRNEAELLFGTANVSYQNLKSKYDKNSKQEDIVGLYAELLSLIEDMVRLSDKMVGVLDNSVVSQTLDESRLNGFKSAMKTYQGQIISTKSTLISLNNSLIDVNNSITSTQVSLSTQKATLEQAIKIAQATLDNTQASTSSSIDSVVSTKNTTQIQLENTIATIKSTRETADNAVKIAQNQYTSAQANYNSQLASIKSQLDSASGQKNSLTQQLENSSIKAPFDGVIISRNIEVGGSVSQGASAFVISNSSQKIIKMDINSENVKYISVGTEVRLDKNGKTATGVVTIVGAASSETTKMFPVEIAFSNEELNNYLVLGDFVDVYIQKNLGTESYIVVPFSSLLVGTNQTYNIYVVGSGSLVEERNVKIGSSNSMEVVVSEGIQEGDKIIVNGTLNISVGDLVEEIE
ncbi:MAG: efflux RND transporter periplasmic adaptor subunit [Candidatus Altimarinota bacterium]